MLLIEKVLTLQCSEIFHNTAEADLVELAGVLEEVHLKPGEELFRKGDTGDCMYFICKGSVRIHEQDHTLAILGENDILGELSILDAEARSASATTEAETLLLRLGQEPFYEIMLHNPEVLKGILKTLCLRLRVMDAEMVALKRGAIPSKAAPSAGAGAPLSVVPGKL